MVVALHYPQEDRYQSYRYPGGQDTRTTTPVERSSTEQYRTPCRNPEGHDESDLCAQWRAAKAAEESALWTRLGFFSALFGIIGLYWQIVLTRRAVQDTGQATDAMRVQNEIAKTAQRPWLSIVDCEIFQMTKLSTLLGGSPGNGARWVDVVIMKGFVTLTNFGITPATGVIFIHDQVKTNNANNELSDFKNVVTNSSTRGDSNLVIPPHGEFKIEFFMSLDPDIRPGNEDNYIKVSLFFGLLYSDPSKEGGKFCTIQSYDIGRGKRGEPDHGFNVASLPISGGIIGDQKPSDLRVMRNDACSIS